MGAALLTLAATVVGGALVLIGDLVARRSEWKRRLRLMLRDAGAEWIASANEARSVLLGARLAGRQLSADESLKWGDRARASSALYTVPGAERLDPQIKAVQVSLNGMAASLAADDETWTQASTACLDAVVAFTNALRAEVGALR